MFDYPNTKILIIFKNDIQFNYIQKERTEFLNSFLRLSVK